MNLWGRIYGVIYGVEFMESGSHGEFMEFIGIYGVRLALNLPNTSNNGYFQHILLQTTRIHCTLFSSDSPCTV